MGDMDSNKLMLRPGEAAEALGFSRSKTYELIASGELPSVRVGSSRRVPLEQLKAWIAARLRDQSESR
jgi:excisionase family DNA binding protein